jgi:ribonucleoside-diphosphate reductase alpha chain
MEIKLEGPYSTFKGSPISQENFRHNLWNKDEDYQAVGTGLH